MHIIGFIIIVFLFLSCNNYQKNKAVNTYQQIEWKILAFEDTSKKFQKNDILWLSAEFLTENDSVFWNSNHEGADKFFIQLQDTVQHPFFFPFYSASEQDSLIITAPKEMVLKDIFNITKCPYFLNNDKTIKCLIKIKQHFSDSDHSFVINLQKDENKIIYDFLEKNKPLYETDTNGIIWLDPLPVPEFKHRKNIKEATVAYSGYFLDGRLIDHSDSLGIRYNDTLQLIEGLNYVIKKLNIGQSAKIIIPSQLAFGACGSFNKTIPPFTPMLYEIKLLQIQ